MALRLLGDSSACVARSALRFAEQPAEELERMTAHVHSHTAAGVLHFPDASCVRHIVLLTLLDHVWLAQRSLVEQALEADVLRRGTQLLGVHQLDSAALAGGDHAVGLVEVHAQWLLADDVLASA